MATTVTRSLSMTSKNAEEYLTALTGSPTVGGSIAAIYPVVFGKYGNNTSGTLKLNEAAMEALYPTATAKPFRLDHHATGGSSPQNSTDCYMTLSVGSVELFRDTVWSAAQNVQKNNENITITAITNSTRSSEWIYGFATGKRSLISAAVGYNTIDITLYFYQYVCNAHAVGNGITTAAVSDNAPYQGDNVTFTATLKSGATFHGWYADAACTQLVSSSMSYTCQAADRMLYAYATRSAQTLTVTMGTQTLISDYVADDVAIVYNGHTIATLSDTGTKMLLCAGKLAASDIAVGRRTLYCSRKLMPHNIVVRLE